MVGGTQKKEIMRDVFFFLLRFNLLLIPFYAIIYFDISFYPLQILFTNLIAIILKSFNYRVTTSDFFLFIGEENFPIDMSRDCIGWKSAYSLFALVFASPGKIKDKLKFLSAWIPVLLVINIFRVTSILMFGLSFGFKYLEIAHTFFWQVMMIILVVVIWYLWMKKR